MRTFSDSTDAQPEQAQEAPTTTPPRRGPRWLVSARLAGLIIGALLLALYVVLLARKDVDALMGSGRLLALPGGWRSLAAILCLGILFVVAVRVWQVGFSGLRLLRWCVAHAEPLLIGSLTVGALAVRVYGISDNLPYTSYPDEPAVADRALHILQSGDYNPHYFVYPNLYTYMQASLYAVRFLGLASPGVVENLNDVVPTDFYLWGRLLTALLGALTVPLVYLAGKRLYGVAVGAIAALFMAASSLHIVFSQLITTDVPATFFTALSLLAIARLLPPRPNKSVAGDGGVSSEGGDGLYPQMRPQLASTGSYLAAGIAMGLAVGAKYNSALVALPFLLAHLFAVSSLSGGRLRSFFSARLWVGLAALAGAFLLTTPFAIFDLPNFLNDVASVIVHYSYGHLGHEGDANWRFYIDAFLSTDTLPTLFTLAGVALAFLRHRKADVLVLAFPLAFYFSMSAYRVSFTRNLLPIFPFTSILAALPLVLLWRIAQSWLVRSKYARKLPARRVGTWALAAVVGLAVLPATLGAVQRGYRQSQPDTRVRAAQWLDSNTQPGAKLWLEPSAPMLTPNRYITDNGQHVTEHSMDWYVANRYEYLVVSAAAYKGVVYDNPQTDPPLREAYLRFFADNQSRLAVAFESNKVDQPGPTIRIYRTAYSPPRQPSEVHAQHSIGAAFHELGSNDATVQLIGADYPLTATAGSALPLTLYWVADRPLSADYTVFVHLLNEAGAVPAQRDTQPRDGTFPTSAWTAGQVVVDEADLSLPANLPPGSYTLRVGLYLQKDGQAVTTFQVGDGTPDSGGDYVLLGPVTVGNK